MRIILLSSQKIITCLLHLLTKQIIQLKLMTQSNIYCNFMNVLKLHLYFEILGILV